MSESEYLRGCLPETLARWELKLTLLDLIEKYPNVVSTGGLGPEHSYIIKTPKISTKKGRIIYKRNEKYFKNSSLLTITHAEQFDKPANPFRKFVYGMDYVIHPQIVIATIRTQFSNNHTISHSAHWIEYTNDVPNHIYSAVHRPNYDWGTKIPRKPKKRSYRPRPITQKDIDAISRSVLYAIEFSKKAQEHPNLYRLTQYI